MAPKVTRTEADYHALAARRGGLWVGSSLPKTTHDKTPWECAKGHRWEAQFKNISAGRWCPTCSNANKPKDNTPKRPEDYRRAAAERGLTWCGPEVRNVSTKTLWRCEKGHTWSVTYSSIVTIGSGCPYCQGVVPLTEEQFRQIAAEHHLEWLGPAASYREKTWWKCAQGHLWEAHYGNVREGKGCPTCNRSSRVSKNSDTTDDAH